MKHCLVIFLFLSWASASAQSTNMVYEKFDVSPDPLNFIHADVDRIPGQNLLAVSATQSNPFYLIDSESMEIVSAYNVGNWFAGSRLSTSTSGKYLLLQQMYYIDFSPNKDREVKFELMEVGTGQIILTIPSAHAAFIHPNEESVIALIGDEVLSFPLNGGNSTRLFQVPDATNCLAISPDGSRIAVSHWPEDGFLENYLTKKKQRKNFKLFKKYRQCISVYNATTWEKEYTAAEMYDLPYVLEFSPDGRFMLCYAVPHSKMVAKSGMGNTKYIAKINAATGENEPVGFVSNSIYEPDFEFSNDGRYLGIVSINAKFPEVWVCDFATGQIIARLELSNRLFEGMKKGFYPPDSGRVGITFSEDDKTLFLTSGSILIKWQIPYED